MVGDYIDFFVQNLIFISLGLDGFECGLYRQQKSIKKDIDKNFIFDRSTQRVQNCFFSMHKFGWKVTKVAYINK